MLIFSMAQPPLRPQDAVMLIPSLEPDDRLPAYVRRLLDKGFQHVVIVDDGSSAAYQPILPNWTRWTACPSRTTS